MGGKQPLIQIGTDQGLLDAPVTLNELVLAPAERADILVDFGERRGERFTLDNHGQPILQFRVGAARVDDHSSGAFEPACDREAR